jgi:Reverse transcriptase (RNA-dependent DNA polymerase)
LKGIIIRYKARLVVQGFFQIFGVDYTDTYSPVAKYVSIRIILALSVHLGLIIHTMDVDTSFLNAILEENIWVQIPPGTKLATGDDGIYKLLKSLYGLKQASRCWNTLMNAYLIEKGFTRMEADPCIVYIRKVVVDVNGVKKTQYQLVSLYVDDLIIASSTKNLITDLEGVFGSRFKMKKLHQIK